MDSKLILKVYISPTPLPQAGCDKRSNFKSSTAGLNSLFLPQTGSFTKAKEISLLYYLPIAEREIDGFVSFPKVSA